MSFNDIFGSSKLVSNVIQGGAFSSGGTKNPLFSPQLDLNFAGSQAFTASVGPTPVFSRASSGTFVGSNGLIQTASTNVARITYNPSNISECLGYLHEASRTNVVTDSENLSAAAWTNAGTTETLSGITAPDGTTNTVYKLEETATTGRHGIFDGFVVTNGTVTHSVFMKQGDRQYGVLHWDVSVATDFAIIVVDLSNGTITQQSTVGTAVTNVTSGVQAYPNGWYRVWITATATTHNYFTVSMSDTSTYAPGTDYGYKSYTGTAGLGIYVWGAQCEVATDMSSYIKTSGGTAVRSSDVCTISGTDFSSFFNSSQGTVLIDYNRTSRNGTNAHLYYFSDTSSNNVIRVITSNTSGDVSNIIAATVTQSSITSVVAQFSNARLGTCYATNDSTQVINGAGLQTDTSVTLPTGINRVDIGAAIGNVFTYCGTFKRIRYFNSRLSNALMLQGTTP